MSGGKGLEGIDPQAVVGTGMADVVLRETVHHAVVVLALPQDSLRHTLASGIERLQFAPADLMQNLTAAMTFLRRHNRQVHRQHTRALALRIGEDMQLADRQRLDEPQICLPALIRLAPDTHHAVHADKRMGQHAADAVHPLAEKGRVVMAVHNAQHLVRAGLERDMEMRGNVCRPRHEVDNLPGQQIRLDTADAHTVGRIERKRVQRTQKVNESLACTAPEIAYINARQYNLLRALAKHGQRLRADRLHGGVAAPAPGIGNGTIGAEIVATVLHLEETARAVVLGVGGQEDIIALPDHAVHLDHSGNLLRMQPRVTARHHNARTGVLAPHTVDGLTVFLVRRVGDRAGVYDDQIGILARLGTLPAAPDEFVHQRA